MHAVRKVAARSSSPILELTLLLMLLLLRILHHYPRAQLMAAVVVHTVSYYTLIGFH